MHASCMIRARRALRAPGHASRHGFRCTVNFTLTESQRALQDAARRFARDVMIPESKSHDESGECATVAVLLSLSALPNLTMVTTSGSEQCCCLCRRCQTCHWPQARTRTPSLRKPTHWGWSTPTYQQHTAGWDLERWRGWCYRR